MIALFQHVPEIQRDGAVLQDKGGDADAAVFLDGSWWGSLSRSQIGLQVRQAGGEILELDLRLDLGQAVQGVQGVGAQVASNDSDFHLIPPLLQRDGFDLAEHALGQLPHGHAAAGGLGGEIPGVHLVEGGEVAHIRQEAGGLDNFVKAGTGSSKMAPTFLQLCSAWAEIPSGVVPVAGSTGI